MYNGLCHWDFLFFQIIDEKSLIKKYQREILSLKHELEQVKRGIADNTYLMGNQEDLASLKQQVWSLCSCFASTCIPCLSSSYFFGSLKYMMSSGISLRGHSCFLISGVFIYVTVFFPVCLSFSFCMHSGSKGVTGNSMSGLSVKDLLWSAQYLGRLILDRWSSHWAYIHSYPWHMKVATHRVLALSKDLEDPNQGLSKVLLSAVWQCL